MKSLIKTIAVAVVIAAPVASFAQSNHPLTRAQVRAELVQLEKAGYNPILAANVHYPADIQAAEARVAAQTVELLPRPTSAAVALEIPQSASKLNGYAQY
jgi:hypothetical protein